MFLIWAMKKGRSAAEEGLQWEIPLEEVFRCIPSLTRQGWQPDHGKMLGGPLVLNCLGQRLPVTGSDRDKKIEGTDEAQVLNPTEIFHCLQ